MVRVTGRARPRAGSQTGGVGATKYTLLSTESEVKNQYYSTVRGQSGEFNLTFSTVKMSRGGLTLKRFTVVRGEA